MACEFSKNTYFIRKLKNFGRPNRVDRHDSHKNRYRPAVIREKKSRRLAKNLNIICNFINLLGSARCKIIMYKGHWSNRNERHAKNI